MAVNNILERMQKKEIVACFNILSQNFPRGTK